jgi:hypothetical protein
MSLSGISTSSLFSYESQDVQTQSKLQRFQQEFQQLGLDLQSGNLSAAQTDFATLEQVGPQGLGNSSTSSSPVQQAFNQLAQDLQSGNLSAAQQDYSNIQQDFQSQATHGHGHHHHHGGGGGGDETSQISQSFQQLGQALQSGNLSSAQQAYTTLQQEIQQLGSGKETTPTQGTAISGVSVTV